ncbi:MAG TPA: tetratricopeptide repeat protein, partial [Pyrinomonadaceae bacterium]|nr:tetratricopeptide repeat protein [Pyrinomonadaceae bacterium]
MSRASRRAGFVRLLLLAATLLLTTHSAPAVAAAVQKQSEADKQAQKGAEYLGKKDWKRAVDSFRKAARADARHVEANYGLGMAFVNLKQPTDALAAFSKVIEAKPNPRVKDALLNTGVIHFALTHYKEAASALELAVPLGDIGSAGHYFLGKSYLLLGRDADALASLQRATSEPQYAQDAFYSVGLVRMKQNQPREAVMPLEQAVRLNSRHAPSLALLGNAYVATERIAEAEKLLRQSLALDPNQSLAHNGLGHALLSMNRIEEAVASFTTALRLQPQSPEAHAGLGTAHARLNRFREAESSFEQAMRLKPDAVEPLLGMCVVQYSQGQYPAMLSTAQQAARLAPKSANAQTMLAAAYATIGQMREATAAVRVALRLESDNYWPHFILGFIMV